MTSLTLLADHLVDGTGSPAVGNSFVRIEDGKITEVGQQADLGTAAEGATNLGNATLLPGLINMHTHLSCSAGTAVLHDCLNDSYEVKLMRAVENARASIMSGVTTIRDCGTLNSIVFAVREATAQNLIPGPHIWAAGQVLTSTAGHCYFFGVECDNETEARRAVRSQVKAGADYIKVMATGGRLTPNSNPLYEQFTREQLIALTEDAARLGRYVAAHCLGTPGVRNAVDARVRTIEHCAFMLPTGIHYEPELAQGIAENNIYVCPTLGTGERRRRMLLERGELGELEQEAREQRLVNLRKLYDLGVKIVSGNDAGMTFAWFDDFQLDFELLVDKIGLSPVQAIHTGTGQAAEAIGGGDFGVLRKGARADILAVAGDASSDIHTLRNLQLVLKSGQVMVDNVGLN